MRSILIAGIAGIAATACGDAGLSEASYPDAGAWQPASDAATNYQCLTSSECPTGWICNDFNVCVAPPPPVGDAGTPPPPPETELAYTQPVSSQRFVYVAMTAEDSLARIDGRNLEVRSTGVGKSPRIVGAIPGEDGAVVLDSDNGTATIVRPPMASTDPDIVHVLGTLPHLNRLDLDPSGRFAVIWFDLQKAIADGGITGIGSFQDVTVVKLAKNQEAAVDLAVGFRPRAVRFDAAGNRAYVITEDGVSVIDLPYATSHGPSIVPPIPVAEIGVPANEVEVEIVATGEYAVVRQGNAASLRVVDVAGANVGQAWTIPLTAAPTDIDLAPDGNRVYAVQRATSKLSIIDVPGDALAPAGMETIDLSSGTVGSLVVSKDGRRGLLYTNASLDERITMVKLDQPGYPLTTWPLKKAVRGVGISPTGTSAIVINAKAFGDPSTATSVDDYIDKSYGYTLVDLATGFGKLQVTPVDPGPFVYSPDGAKAYVALDGGDTATATRALQIVEVMTGVVTTKQLGSPPSAVGILPGIGQAFVAQRHPLGRVTFVELIADSIRTITGFDLNGQIVN